MKEIKIGLEFTTVCNINCRYCYARDNYKKDWQKELSEENFQILFNNLERISTEFNLILVLLGGEPTESKYFKKLLSLKNVTFEIFTNFINIDNLIFGKNITYTISFHSEYLSKILKNLNTLQNKNIGKNSNIDILLSSKFKPSYNFLKIVPELKILREHFIIRIEVIEDIHNNNFLETIEETTIEFKKIFDLYDKNYFDNFYQLSEVNKVCYMKEYNLNFFGDLKQTCSDKFFGNLFTNNIENIIKNLKNDNKIFCHKGIVCPCDNLLKNNTKRFKK